jgi:hypothetical protein
MVEGLYGRGRMQGPDAGEDKRATM